VTLTICIITIRKVAGNNLYGDTNLTSIPRIPAITGLAQFILTHEFTSTILRLYPYPDQWCIINFMLTTNNLRQGWLYLESLWFIFKKQFIFKDIIYPSNNQVLIKKVQIVYL
jgi:hypothetical protein